MNAQSVRLDPVDEAIAAIAAGRPVVVVDDADRENEGDIIFAAAHATPELLAFTVRHSSGVICAPMPPSRLDRLDLPMMVTRNADPFRTAFAITVDARQGITTGISAADRAHTLRLLADDSTGPEQLVRPGHVFPLAARPGGVLERRGHTEAAVDLVTLAGLEPVGVLVELVHDDGTMMRGPALRRFADEHGLAMISIAGLATHMVRHTSQVERVATTVLPTSHGTFTAHGYRSRITGVEHLALVHGDVAGRETLVRVHSECLTGDAFDSARCDCGPQLRHALERAGRAEAGVVVYLRGQEGRGIGLIEKLRAYGLQDQGRDTVDANLELGHPADQRSYAEAAQILRDLGVGPVRLMTNNPGKVDALEDAGLVVAERVGIAIAPGPHNARYLATKRDRLGHLI